MNVLDPIEITNSTYNVHTLVHVSVTRKNAETIADIVSRYVATLLVVLRV